MDRVNVSLMMRWTRTILNSAVAAALTLTAPVVAAQEPARVDELLSLLAQPDNEGWRRIERQIITEWSRSGSAAMDLLLQRAREAMRADDMPAAVAHLTALTDHAPDFAEGWNLRATAWFRSGQLGPSLADLERALTLNPHHFGALAGLGAILSETGDKTGALRAYKAALAIHPHLEQVSRAAERLETELAGQAI